MEALEAAEVPLELGQASLSTWIPHEETVWRVVNESGGEAVIAYNKGTVPYGRASYSPCRSQPARSGNSSRPSQSRG